MVLLQLFTSLEPWSFEIQFCMVPIYEVVFSSVTLFCMGLSFFVVRSNFIWFNFTFSLLFGVILWNFEIVKSNFTWLCYNCLHVLDDFSNSLSFVLS
jgi:hypothetical protein